jgi:nucleoid-associated protein YgaU
MKMLKMLQAAALATAICSGCDYRERQARENDRDNSVFRAAMADYQAGRLDAAASGFEKVIESTPLNATARFQLASLQHDHQRKYLEAIANYRIYAEIAPKSDKSQVALERAKLCEEQYKAKVEQDIRNSENAGLVSELNELKKQLGEMQATEKELRATIAAKEKTIADISAENTRVRRFVGSIGDGESTEKPVVVADVKKLLDEEEDDEDRIRFSADVAQLLRDEVVESLEPPMPVLEKKPPKPVVEREWTAPETYVVKEGDTLYKLAKEFYGDTGAWKLIRDANKATVTTDGRIKAGQELKLPKPW